jgi:hypothetical protein
MQAVEGSGGGRRADAPSATCRIRPVSEALTTISDSEGMMDLGRLPGREQDSTLNSDQFGMKR